VTPAYANDWATVYHGDALDTLRQLPAASVHCCVTSPPYYGLRDYGCAGQMGLEKSPAEYVAGMVAVFEEVRRVLRGDGTLWLNIGDSYAGGGGYSPGAPSNRNGGSLSAKQDDGTGAKTSGIRPSAAGVKGKDLIGVPWQLAFALRDAGWYLRQDIIWNKPAPMPESVTDRCTKAHEYLFLLSRSPRYYYDAEAIKEEATCRPRPESSRWKAEGSKRSGEMSIKTGLGFNQPENGANRRSVWTVASTPYAEAHFATFPPKLIEPCILAGTSAEGCCGACGAPLVRQTKRGFVGDGNPFGHQKKQGNRTALSGEQMRKRNADRSCEVLGWQPSCKCNAATVPCTVIDPFLGSGTTVATAIRWGRRGVGVELNPEYIRLAEKRIGEAVASLGMFAEATP
jgi:DNA modification methylase